MPRLPRGISLLQPLPAAPESGGGRVLGGFLNLLAFGFVDDCFVLLKFALGLLLVVFGFTSRLDKRFSVFMLCLLDPEKFFCEI